MPPAGRAARCRRARRRRRWRARRPRTQWDTTSAKELGSTAGGLSSEDVFLFKNAIAGRALVNLYWPRRSWRSSSYERQNYRRADHFDAVSPIRFLHTLGRVCVYVCVHSISVDNRMTNDVCVSTPRKSGISARARAVHVLVWLLARPRFTSSGALARFKSFSSSRLWTPPALVGALLHRVPVR